MFALLALSCWVVEASPKATRRRPPSPGESGGKGDGADGGSGEKGSVGGVGVGEGWFGEGWRGEGSSGEDSGGGEGGACGDGGGGGGSVGGLSTVAQTVNPLRCTEPSVRHMSAEPRGAKTRFIRGTPPLPEP